MKVYQYSIIRKTYNQLALAATFNRIFQAVWNYEWIIDFCRLHSQLPQNIKIDWHPFFSCGLFNNILNM